MDAKEILLFISTASKACSPCIDYLKQNPTPIRIIRLDTEATRKHVENGTLFKVINVPTLLVQYGDGNAQLFEGTAKCMAWITAYTNLSTEESIIAEEDEPTPRGPMVTKEPPPSSEPVEIEFLGEEKPKNGLKPPPKSPMKSLVEEAKKMAKELDHHLTKDLPPAMKQKQSS